MILGDTELNAQEAITEFRPAPTRWETLKAAMDNFTSVSISSSEMDYYKNQIDASRDEWIKSNPKDEELYNRILSADKHVLERLDALYEIGNISAISNWNTSSNAGMVNIGGIGIGKDYLKFREIQSSLGLYDISSIRDKANTSALIDYKKSAAVMDASEYWGMKMIGTMAGALQDPVTLATLPLGTFKTGGTIGANALKAFIEEAKIETVAQATIAPTAYGFKKEIGLNTSIMAEATNAMASIATAGVFRGIGSAAFDLTADGIKALRLKDPQLADDYEATFKNADVSNDNKSFLDDMHKAEFEDPINMEISNPSEKGIELSKAEPIPQTKPEIFAQISENNKKVSNIQSRIAQVKAAAEIPIGGSEDEAAQAVKNLFKKTMSDEKYLKSLSKDDIKELEARQNEQLEQEAMDAFGVTREEMIRFDEDSLIMKVGVDEQGEPIHKSYKELMEEHDLIDAYINKAKDCGL